jgi:hypothetical protein
MQATEVEYEQETRWRAQGPCIAWIYQGIVYLLPGPTLAAAQSIADRLNVRLPLNEKTLGRAAYERGKLRDHDYPTRGKYSHRETILGKRPHVYEMKASTIIPDMTTFGIFEDLDEDEVHEAMKDLLSLYEVNKKRMETKMEA